MTFPTTRWSLLAEATLHGDTRSQEALAVFCQRYRQPVVEFLRWRGLAEERVEDAAHDFLLQLLTHSSLRRADQVKGRFRNFLCGAMRHFLADDADRHRAQKRGGGSRVHGLNGHSHGNGDGPLPEPADEGREDQLFLDREWAIHVIERTMEGVAAEWRVAGKGARFEALSGFLPGAVGGADYEVAAARLGLSGTAIRSEVSRLRARFRSRLRGEVAATVSGPEEVDDEMRHLCKVFLQAADTPSTNSLPQATEKS